MSSPLRAMYLVSAGENLDASRPFRFRLVKTATDASSRNSVLQNFRSAVPNSLDSSNWARWGP